jgi:hypothetical protein
MFGKKKQIDTLTDLTQPEQNIQQNQQQQKVRPLKWYFLELVGPSQLRIREVNKAQVPSYIITQNSPIAIIDTKGQQRGWGYFVIRNYYTANSKVPFLKRELLEKQYIPVSLERIWEDMGKQYTLTVTERMNEYQNGVNWMALIQRGLRQQQTKVNWWLILIIVIALIGGAIGMYYYHSIHPTVTTTVQHQANTTVVVHTIP